MKEVLEFYIISMTWEGGGGAGHIHCPTKSIRTPPNIQLGAKMGIEIYRYQWVVVLLLTLVEIFIILGQ